MAKIKLTERFQQLAGIKPLYETEAQLNEKRKINWLNILLDVILLIKAIAAIPLEEQRGKGRGSITPEVQQAAARVLSVINSNREEFSSFPDLDSILTAAESLSAGEIPVTEGMLKEGWLKNLWNSFKEWILDRYTYEVDEDPPPMVRPQGDGSDEAGEEMNEGYLSSNDSW